MSVFCIRDDDISFFTSRSDIETAWSWWPHNVTLGVIPYSVESRYMSLPGRDHAFHQLGESEFAISENFALCDYLRCTQNKFSIAMHGCTHKYRICGENLMAEYSSFDSDLLNRETRRGLEELRRCFGYSPKIFIPPDNAISLAGIRVVHRAGLSYVQTPFPVRPDSLGWFVDYYGSLRHWVERLYYRISKNVIDLRICGSTEASISAAILVKFDDEDLLYKRVSLAIEKKWPITLATHYWEMKNESYRSKFKRLTEYLLSQGLTPVSMERLYCEIN